MVKENIYQEFRLKSIYKTRNYFTQEMNQSELVSRKHRKVTSLIILKPYLFQLLWLLDLFQFLILVLWLIFLLALRALQ